MSGHGDSARGAQRGFVRSRRAPGPHGRLRRGHGRWHIAAWRGARPRPAGRRGPGARGPGSQGLLEESGTGRPRGKGDLGLALKDTKEETERVGGRERAAGRWEPAGAAPRPRVAGEARAGRCGQRPSGQSTGRDVGAAGGRALLRHGDTVTRRSAASCASQQDFCKQGPEWRPGGASVSGRDPQCGQREWREAGGPSPAASSVGPSTEAACVSGTASRFEVAGGAGNSHRGCRRCW